MLLLGPGESGKTTIFRQIKLLYGNYSDEERKTMSPYVHKNIINGIQAMLNFAQDVDLVDEIMDQESIKVVQDIEETDKIDEDLGAKIKSLWNDPILMQLWDRRSEFQIIESFAYFMENIDRIAQPDFEANLQDVLHVRVKTSGIMVDRYNINKQDYELYDVGGQRNERKKWIHCFDNVTAVIFVIALSEFDQYCYEDLSSNRMIEALNLFKEICSNPYFNFCSIILFLNKKDLFEEKIKVKYIADVPEFSDYSGPRGSYDEGVRYFLEKFRSYFTANNQHYYHVTCATDTQNVNVVFTSCQNTILLNHLQKRLG